MWDISNEFFVLIEMQYHQNTDNPTNADDVIVDWCRAGDWYFSHDAPMHPPRDKHRGEKEYEILDPLIGPNGEPYVGTHNIRLSWAALKRNGYPFLAGILEVLCNEDTFERNCVPKEKPTPVGAGRRETMNRRNIEELSKIGYLVDIRPPNRNNKQLRLHLGSHGVIRFASLFTRAKANATRRLLLNGKPGNAALNPPPYFTFFSPETIVRTLIALETFFGFTVDVRHCFHRIPMHRKMARYYAILHGTVTWIPTVVPMGATWGPALGQATTVAMILYREQNETDLGIRIPTEGIPSILRIVDDNGTVIGFILIVIDNIAVVCKNEKITDAWYRRLERNSKVLGIFPFKKETQTHWTEAHFEFIGLEYEMGRWRHCADRILKWRLRYENSPADQHEHTLRTLDPEALQSLVGVMVWDKRLRALDCTGMREIFAIQRRALDIDTPTGPTAAELEFIRHKWSVLVNNEFQQWNDVVWPPSITNKTPVVLVTDASLDRWSWLELVNGSIKSGVDGTPENPNDVFPDTVAKLEIYYKELYTILEAFRRCRDAGRTEIDITLVGDSQAVIGSIRKRMGPEGAWWMIDEIVFIVTTCRWGLGLKWVESDGNAAHPATHREKLTAYRTARSWLVSQSVDYPPAVGGNGKRDINGKLI